MHLTRFPTVLSFQPGRGALRPSAHLCPSTQDPVNLLGSWVDFTSREGSAELGGKWDNCGEVGGGNHAARQEKAMEKGRTSSWGDQLLALAGARWELHGQSKARSRLGGQACVDGQSWLPFLALPFVSSVTPGSDCTSLSHSFHL